jgi:mannose-1-phosphate guanylyltransferase
LTDLPFFAVLMAGGGGTRLWPLSRPEKPKQVLPLLGGRSLFELSVERWLAMLPPENIYVIANRPIAAILRPLAPRLPEKNFICEPSPRNTAPAIAYMLAVLRSRAPKFVMGVLPCDHYIANLAEFQALIHAAKTLAEQGALVTLGIEPTEPNTGYGYLEKGEPLLAMEDHPAFRVCRFVEKPDLEKARTMLVQRGYVWNSGMFFWRSDVIEEEYRRQQPLIADGMDRIRESLGDREPGQEVLKAWAAMPSLSIDYAIMENASAVAVLPTGNLGWTDIGNWDALMDLYQQHPELRTGSVGEQYDVGSQSVLVFREGEYRRVLVTVGLGNVMIVETEDAILVCQRGKSQDIRKIVETIKKKNSPTQE